MVIRNGQKWTSPPAVQTPVLLAWSEIHPELKKKKILLLAFSLMLSGFIFFYMVYIFFFS